MKSLATETTQSEAAIAVVPAEADAVSDFEAVSKAQMTGPQLEGEDLMAMVTHQLKIPRGVFLALFLLF